MSSGSFLSYAYSRLAGGDIQAIRDRLHPTWSPSFGYDPVGRLSTALGSWGYEGYNYDYAGNRLSKTVDAAQTTYAYVTGSNHLASASGSEAGCPPTTGWGT